MKYNLRSIVVGYEVPLLDLDDKTYQDQLINEIHDSFTSFDELISSYMDTVETHTSNHIFKAVYIFKVNVGDMTTDKIDEHFKELKSKIETAVEKFLRSRDVIFEKIESK